MTVREYLLAVNECDIDNEKKQKFTKKYGIAIRDDVMKMISIAKDSVFVAEERRLLSYDEIVDFGSNIDFDIEDNGIIPIVDCYDNDYIVFLLKEDKWAKFNVSDKVIFKKRDSFEELI